MPKKARHKTIKEIIKGQDIVSQDVLLNILIDKGFGLTQATLSRDIKELRIVKVPTAGGSYAYRLPEAVSSTYVQEEMPNTSLKFTNIEFSGQLAVAKTRPGYAMAIAAEIDRKATKYILGTVAGDDTILLIPRENISREEILEVLAQFIH